MSMGGCFGDCDYEDDHKTKERHRKSMIYRNFREGFGPETNGHKELVTSFTFLSIERYNYNFYFRLS